MCPFDVNTASFLVSIPPVLFSRARDQWCRLSSRQPSFTALLELLQPDEERHQRLSRRLLQLLAGCRQLPQLSTQPALLELGMTCCRTLHDSVT